MQCVVVWLPNLGCMHRDMRCLVCWMVGEVRSFCLDAWSRITGANQIQGEKH